MTGISQLNVVVQQGNNAQDVQHIKQQATEHIQVVAAQQEAIREADLRSKVPQAEESDKLGLKRDKAKGNNEREQSEEEKKKKEEEGKKMAPTGKLLDTVA